MEDKILCPKCGQDLSIVRSTDWDNLETFFTLDAPTAGLQHEKFSRVNCSQ